jgi:hypothetical protein
MGDEVNKEIVFRATKYVGDVEVVTLSGTYSDITKDYLAIFNPITPEHGFQVELAQGINPMEFLQHITLSEETEPDLDVADESGWLEYFPEDWYFTPTPGQLVRVASLAQADRVWQIIGIAHGDEIVSLLKNPEEEHVATERYFCDRVVAEYAVHSDGPGPVSWDGGSAVCEVGQWWLYAYEGDSLAEDYLVPKPTNSQAALLESLALNNANELLALCYVPCLWDDETLKGHFEELLADYSQLNHLRVNISDEEMTALVTALRETIPLVQKLVSLLQDPQGVGAQSLLAGMSRALGNQAPGLLFANFDAGSDENDWNL